MVLAVGVFCTGSTCLRDLSNFIVFFIFTLSKVCCEGCHKGYAQDVEFFPVLRYWVSFCPALC